MHRTIHQQYSSLPFNYSGLAQASATLWKMALSTCVALACLFTSASTEAMQGESYQQQYDFSGDKLAQMWPSIFRGAPGTPILTKEFMVKLRARYPQFGNWVIPMFNKPATQLNDEELTRLIAAEHNAWRALFSGRLNEARKLSEPLGIAGLPIGNYALLYQSLYLSDNDKEYSSGLKKIIGLEDILKKGLSYEDFSFQYFGIAYAKIRSMERQNTMAAFATGYYPQAEKSFMEILRIQPGYAFASASIAGMNASAIEKAGALAKVSYDASDETVHKYFALARQTQPPMPVVEIEHALSYYRLQGKSGLAKSIDLLEKAQQIKPITALEELELRNGQQWLQKLKTIKN